MLNNFWITLILKQFVTEMTSNFWQHCAISAFEIKFGYSEKATKFEKIFHLKFDATQ